MSFCRCFHRLKAVIQNSESNHHSDKTLLQEWRDLITSTLHKINAGGSQGWPPLTTATSVSFFLTRSAFIQTQNIFTTTLHQTGDVSDARSNFTSAPGASQTSTETVLCSQRMLFNCTHKGAGARCSLYHFISKHEWNYVHAMSCQLSH